MPDRPSVLQGRHLLDRRDFLAHLATGMGGIALSAMLAEEGLLAADVAQADVNPRRESARTQGAALSRQGQAGLAHLLHRGGQPSGHLGLQARARKAARPADARRGQADHVPRRKRQPGPEPLEIQAEGSDGQVHLRALTSFGRMRRRAVFCALADVEDQYSWTRRDVHEHGLHARGVPQHGRVGQLRVQGPRTRTCPLMWRSPTRAAIRSKGRPTGPMDSCRRCIKGPRSTPSGRSTTWRDRADRARRRPGRPRFSPPAQRRTPEPPSRRFRAVGPDRGV